MTPCVKCGYFMTWPLLCDEGQVDWCQKCGHKEPVKLHHGCKDEEEKKESK
jgi:hypothetical protein